MPASRPVQTALRSSAARHCTTLLAKLDPSAPCAKYLAFLGDFVVLRAPEYCEETMLGFFDDAEWVPRCEIIARTSAAIDRADAWEKRVSRSYSHDDYERLRDIEVFLTNDFSNMSSGELEHADVEEFVDSVKGDPSGLLCAEGVTGFLLVRIIDAARTLFPGMILDAVDLREPAAGVKRKRTPAASTAAPVLFPWPRFMNFEAMLVGAATIPRLPLRIRQLCSLEKAGSAQLLAAFATKESLAAV